MGGGGGGGAGPTVVLGPWAGPGLKMLRLGRRLRAAARWHRRLGDAHHRRRAAAGAPINARVDEFKRLMSTTR